MLLGDAMAKHAAAEELADKLPVRRGWQVALGAEGPHHFHAFGAAAERVAAEDEGEINEISKK